MGQHHKTIASVGLYEIVVIRENLYPSTRSSDDRQLRIIVFQEGVGAAVPGGDAFLGLAEEWVCETSA
jgi:hypothetical protein